MSAAAPPLPHSRNPWPGLISYTEAQAHLFFGREAETGELLRLIRRDTLTVLFGRSGLGKTSLLRAGVFPRLRREGFFPVVLRLDYSPQAPAPVEQVKTLTEAAARESQIDIESAQPGPDAETLWEYFHRLRFWGPRNDTLVPVLVFDQFEEIFTHDSNRQANSELLAQLADLAENRIPEAVRQSAEASSHRQALQAGAPNYKIVLSLREDFVWRLDTLRPILPAVMRNRFALGPLDAAHGLQIVRNAGKQWVSDEVAHDIIEAVISNRRGEGPGAAADEVEPAYLNVMCNELFERMAAAGQTAITRELVASEKGEILESLYEGSFRGLDDSVRRFVEQHLVTQAGFRATLPVDEARRENLSDADLQTLVGRHLLRFEDRLGTRHVELAHDLLTELVLKRREQRELRERAHLRRAQWWAQLRTAALAAVFVAIAASVFYWLAYMHPTVSYYATLDRKYGSYEVIGRLSNDEASHRLESLRVFRKGFRGEITAVEAVNGYGHLIMESQLDGSILFPTNGQSGQFCRLELSYDENGQALREVALDEQNRMVFALNYAPTQAEASRNVRRASVVAADGSTIYSTFDIEYDSDGYPREIRFLLGGGTPKDFGAQIIDFKNSKLGATDELFLDSVENPVPSNGDFAGESFNLDARGEVTQEIAHNLDGQPVPHTDGEPPIVRRQDDEWGNTLDVSFYDAERRPAIWGDEGLDRLVYTLDAHGSYTMVHFFDLHGHPVPQNITGCYGFVYERDQNGSVAANGCLDARGEPMNQLNTGYQKDAFEYDSSGRIIASWFYDKNGKAVADATTRDPGIAGQIFPYPAKPPDGFEGCYGWLMGYDQYFNQTDEVCLDSKDNAYSLDALFGLSQASHDLAFDFARAFALDQKLVSQSPAPLYHLELEQSALTDNQFGMCLDQAKAIKDFSAVQLWVAVRDATLLACQFASSNKPAARATAASLLSFANEMKSRLAENCSTTVPRPAPGSNVTVLPQLAGRVGSGKSSNACLPLVPIPIPSDQSAATARHIPQPAGTELAEQTAQQAVSWNFAGTEYYIQTSSRFQAQRDAWDKLFASLQIGDAQGAIDAINQLQPSLR